MESIKNATIIKFLTGKSFKTKCIKLAIMLACVFLMFLDASFGYIAFALASIYIAFECSADSIFWLMLIGVIVPYIDVYYLHVLMWEMIAIFVIKLIYDIVKNKIDYKNWRFITLISLFVALCLLIVLPLAKTYSFVAQINRVSMFAVLVLGVVYVKEIKIKDFLKLFVVSTMAICLLFALSKAFGGGNGAEHIIAYSKGELERFSVFNMDPNFTGSMALCVIAVLFFMYKKKWINKYWHFGGLAVMGYISLITISKATYLIIALFGVYIVVENIVTTIKTKNAKWLLELLWYVLILLLVCGAGWKYIDSMYCRIKHGDGWWTSEGNFGAISNLTTGRINLWIGYLKEIFGSWQILLFGAGAMADYVGAGGEHCMPLSYLYRYGALSTLVMLAIFIVAVMPYIKKAKVYSFVPMVLITGIYCSIGSISAKYIYVFALSFLTLACNGLIDDNQKLKTTYVPDIKAKDEQDSVTQNDLNKIKQQKNGA